MENVAVILTIILIALQILREFLELYRDVEDEDSYDE
jgi:hypothetical protein